MSHQSDQERAADQELVRSAGTAVQAHERLYYRLKQKLKESDHCDAKQALTQSARLLDELRDLKSKIEGTHFKFTPVVFDSKKLTELKHLVISHTPSSLQQATKDKIVERLKELLGGQVKQILFACLLACPWFAHAQAEIPSQARNNILYVVFVSRNEQFFSLAAPHERELCETIDEEFVFATDIRHLCSQLLRGNVRAVEAFCSPAEAVLYSSDEWQDFVHLLDPVSLLNKSFVDRCFGQAVGGLIKKKKDSSGKVIIKDDVTASKLCDSFRLLKYVECAVSRKAISSWVAINLLDADILFSLREIFEGHGHKDQLFEMFMNLKDKLEKNCDGVPQAHQGFTPEVKEWLARVRLSQMELSLPSEVSDTHLMKLKDVLKMIRLEGVEPWQVVVAAEAGSHMYGLSTPTSDVDYIVVFKESTKAIVSSCSAAKEHMDSRGQKQEVEAAGYEVRQFCEMLLKGAVNIFELVFADEVCYASEAWKTLVEKRSLFLSEQIILQYLGFVKTHLNIIEGGKHTGKPKERKLFYHVLHKLLSLESFVQGKPPVIRCSSEQRDYILKIRKGPLEGELERDVLLSVVRQRLDAVKQALCQRENRVREFGDYRFLQTWLLAVRGVQLEPLCLGNGPLVS